MTISNLDLWSNLIDKAEAALSVSGGKEGIAKWLIGNTRAPDDPMRPWSFKNHEYMLGILKLSKYHTVVSKPTQTGLSELAVRISLALLAKLQNIHLIYVMPTSKRASGFASSRIYPVIHASPRLKPLLSGKVASNELIQISSSFMHLTGAQTEEQAISIPARVLLRDEFSFGNPAVLATYMSRLAHQTDEEKLIFDFSSPLYPKSGITALLDESTYNHYMVYHTPCGQWTEIEELTDLILPGFDAHLTELEASDLKHPKVRIDDAYIKCRKCGNPITLENLATPEYRAWVPAQPDRSIEGFRVTPMALPIHRNPAKLIRELPLYGSNVRWQQYALGVAAESSDSTITEAALNSAFTVSPITPELAGGTVQGALAGCDQGKLNYMCHGKLIGDVLEVFHVEIVRQGGDHEPGKKFVERFSQFNCIKGIIDAGPDVSMVRHVQQHTRYNSVYGCYFVRTPRIASLEIIKEDEVDGMVKVGRTPIMDQFVAAFNAGKIKLPRGSRYEQDLRSHLMEPKRIVNSDALGEEAAVWVSKGADHFAFALLYLYIAAKLVESSPSTIFIPPSRLVSSVKMRSRPLPA